MFLLAPSSPSFAVGETLQVDVVGNDLFAGRPFGDELVAYTGFGNCYLLLIGLLRRAQR